VRNYWYKKLTYFTVRKTECCGSGMFIPDPNFFIPDPGFRVNKIPDPGSGSASKNLRIYNPKNFSKLSEL
jgi:hypothetical protein